MRFVANVGEGEKTRARGHLKQQLTFRMI